MSNLRYKSTPLLISFLLVSGSVSISADTVYTYQGNPFTTVTSPYSTSDLVSGSFRTATPLAPNTNTLVLATTGFSFSDGVQTITNTSPGIDPSFSVRTDSTGSIVGWSVFIQYTANGFGIITIGPPNSNALDAGVLNDSSEGSNSGDPGVWTRSSSVVPEPASVALFAVGSLAVALLKRSRRASRPSARERPFSWIC